MPTTAPSPRPPTRWPRGSTLRCERCGRTGTTGQISGHTSKGACRGAEITLLAYPSAPQRTTLVAPPPPPPPDRLIIAADPRGAVSNTVLLNADPPPDPTPAAPTGRRISAREAAAALRGETLPLEATPDVAGNGHHAAPLAAPPSPAYVPAPTPSGAAQGVPEPPRRRGRPPGSRNRPAPPPPEDDEDDLLEEDGLYEDDGGDGGDGLDWPLEDIHPVRAVAVAPSAPPVPLSDPWRPVQLSPESWVYYRVARTDSAFAARFGGNFTGSMSDLVDEVFAAFFQLELGLTLGLVPEPEPPPEPIIPLTADAFRELLARAGVPMEAPRNGRTTALSSA